MYFSQFKSGIKYSQRITAKTTMHRTLCPDGKSVVAQQHSDVRGRQLNAICLGWKAIGADAHTVAKRRRRVARHSPAESIAGL
jgi:hypothetical protein